MTTLSKDKDVIDVFIDKILRLGCAIDATKIFCTSIEDMNIKTGEDLRKHMKKSMLGCDYVFLMISKNYIQSTMCLNEMGACWIIDKKVKPFLFPPLDHKTIWLSEIIKNSAINDSKTLNSLREELIQTYTMKTSGLDDWEKQKNNFVECFNQLYFPLSEANE